MSPKSSPPRHPTSLVGVAFRLLFHMLLLTALAWLLEFILMFGLVWLWGWDTVNLMLQQAISTVSISIPIHLLPKDSVLLAAQAIQSNSAEYSFSVSGAKVNHAINLFNQGLLLATLATNLIVLRALYFIRGSAILIFSIGLGFIEGLIQREIRKYQGARESTLFFHRSKQLLMMIFLSSFFLFLFVPLPFHPTWILLILAIVMGYVTSLATRSFKKYL